MYRWNNIACDTLDELMALMQRTGAPLPTSASTVQTVVTPSVTVAKITPEPARKAAEPKASRPTASMQPNHIPLDRGRQVLSALYKVVNTDEFFAKRINLTPTKVPGESDTRWAAREQLLRHLQSINNDRPVISSITLGFLLRKLHRLNTAIPVPGSTILSVRLTMRNKLNQAGYAFKLLA